MHITLRSYSRRLSHRECPSTMPHQVPVPEAEPWDREEQRAACAVHPGVKLRQQPDSDSQGRGLNKSSCPDTHRACPAPGSPNLPGQGLGVRINDTYTWLPRFCLRSFRRGEERDETYSWQSFDTPLSRLPFHHLSVFWCLLFHC